MLLIMKVDCLVYVLLVFFVVCTMVSIVVMNKEVTAPYMDEIFHFSMTQNYLEGRECKKQIYRCRKLHLLGSEDHDFSWTLCDRHIVSLDEIVNRRYCKLYSLFFATGDAGCSLSALRWMNMLFLYLTAFSVYQIIHFLHPANVLGSVGIFIYRSE